MSDIKVLQGIGKLRKTVELGSKKLQAQNFFFGLSGSDDGGLADDWLASNDQAKGFDALCKDRGSMVNLGSLRLPMESVAASQSAMDILAGNTVPRDIFGSAGAAFDVIAASSMAIGKYITGAAGLAPSSYENMNAVALSPVVMDAVVSNPFALTCLENSQLAISLAKYSSHVAGLDSSQYADFDDLVASQSARDALVASASAMGVILRSKIGFSLLFTSPYIDAAWAGVNEMASAMATYLDGISSGSGTYGRVNIPIDGSLISGVEVQSIVFAAGASGYNDKGMFLRPSGEVVFDDAGMGSWHVSTGVINPTDTELEWEQEDAAYDPETFDIDVRTNVPTGLGKSITQGGRGAIYGLKFTRRSNS